MDSRFRSLALLVGVLLVTVPLYAPLFDVTGMDYHYEATELTVDDDELTFVNDAPRNLFYGVSGFDCYYDSTSRTCTLEAATLDGPITVHHPTLRHVAGTPSLDTDEQYLAYNDGRVFMYTTDWNASTQSFVIGLERTNASEALDSAARSADHAPAPVLAAIRDGSARADDSLWRDDSREAMVVEQNRRYYVVSQDPRSSVLSENPLLERICEGIAVVLGLRILARVWST